MDFGPTPRRRSGLLWADGPDALKTRGLGYAPQHLEQALDGASALQT